MQNYILRSKNKRDNIIYKEKQKKKIRFYYNINRLRKDNKQINLARNNLQIKY